MYNDAPASYVKDFIDVEFYIPWIKHVFPQVKIPAKRFVRVDELDRNIKFNKRKQEGRFNNKKKKTNTRVDVQKYDIEAYFSNHNRFNCLSDEARQIDRKAILSLSISVLC